MHQPPNPPPGWHGPGPGPGWNGPYGPPPPPQYGPQHPPQAPPPAPHHGPPPDLGEGPPPPDAMAVAAQWRLGAPVHSYKTPGAGTGIGCAVIGIAVFLVVEFLLISYGGVIVIGGLLFVLPIGAIWFLASTLRKAGTFVHVFQHGLILSRKGHHDPVNWQEVAALRIYGDQASDTSDRALVRRNGSEVRLTSDLYSQDRLYRDLAATARQYGWRTG